MSQIAFFCFSLPFPIFFSLSSVLPCVIVCQVISFFIFFNHHLSTSHRPSIFFSCPYILTLLSQHPQLDQLALALCCSFALHITGTIYHDYSFNFYSLCIRFTDFDLIKRKKSATASACSALRHAARRRIDAVHTVTCV